MSFNNWSKVIKPEWTWTTSNFLFQVLIFFASCYFLTECSLQHHSKHYPWQSHHQHQHQWTSLPSPIFVEGPNTVYGGQDTSHYSFTTKGQGFSSYQSVSMVCWKFDKDSIQHWTEWVYSLVFKDSDTLECTRCAGTF